MGNFNENPGSQASEVSLPLLSSGTLVKIKKHAWGDVWGVPKSREYPLLHGWFIVENIFFFNNNPLTGTYELMEFKSSLSHRATPFFKGLIMDDLNLG